MECRKTYLQPVDMVLNAIHDACGMQRGEMTLCDSPRGRVRYKIMMRGEVLEYQFYVKDIGSMCSRVSIELTQDDPDTQRHIDSEFALLDYALLDKAKIDLAEIEEWDRKIAEEQEAREGKGSG